MSLIRFDFAEPLIGRPCSLRVQTVLFGTKLFDIEKSLASIARAAEIAMNLGQLTSVEVAYGDSSDKPVLQAQDIEKYRELFPSIAEIFYEFFGANLGSAGGQNRLLDNAMSDLIFVTNPDVRVAPTVFSELIRPFRIPGVGVTEARQIPIEHPKDYNLETGETTWAAGACMMLPTRVAKALNGFDAESFFLYCDDVDLSWRVRQAGLKIIHQPSATVFHDKRLSLSCTSAPGPTELFYSAEAQLILAHKYGRTDILDRALARFDNSGLEYLRRAATAYRLKKAGGRLPIPISAPNIAEFVGENFARHRFAL